jgi:hypothetical protein
MQIETPTGKKPHAKPKAMDVDRAEWAHILVFGSLIQKD